MRALLVPVVAALVGMAGSLSATLALEKVAQRTVDRALRERLAATGATAALLAQRELDRPRLSALMKTDGLDGAYLVDPGLKVVASASGPSGGRVDLLRVDVERLRAALGGRASVAGAYALGPLAVEAGYFPLRQPDGKVWAVLVLEAGKAFRAAHRTIERALWTAVALSGLGALALGLLATGYLRAERLRRQEAARAARVEVLGRMAAMAAHEIRNPLAVIQGTVELMRLRPGEPAEPLEDILGEVERLRRLTEDFTDLATDRPLAITRTDLRALLEDAARTCRARFPEVRVRLEVASSAPVELDPGRIHQVFANLLGNAAQARPDGEIAVRVTAADGFVRICVSDEGPGLAPEIRARLFDPFVTSKEGGTGLGLALSRRIVERHGGTLRHLERPPPGATFEVRLPAQRA